MQDKESDGSTKLKGAIDRALVRFVTDRLTEEVRDDVLTAIKEAGMVIVPREPTEGMLASGGKQTYASSNDNIRWPWETLWNQHQAEMMEDASTIYRAMITAGEE